MAIEKIIKIISEAQATVCDLVAVHNLDPVVLVGKSAIEAATQTRADGTSTDQKFADRVVDNAKEGAHALGRLAQKVGKYAGSGISGLWRKPGEGQIRSSDSPKKMVAESKCQIIPNPSSPLPA